MKLGPFLASAVRDLGMRLDSRGLVPIAEARRRVRAAKTFERGKSHVISNQISQPTDADYLWASLLSLDSAPTFVREASRIVWKHSPRGFDNVAPHERYGDAQANEVGLRRPGRDACGRPRGVV